MGSILSSSAESRLHDARTMLVIDDSRTNLHVIGQRLGALGYLVVLSDNGREALDLISAHGFDLVLLDMVMPDVLDDRSGLEILAGIRAIPDTADLPVIMITAPAVTGAARSRGTGSRR